MQSFQLELGYRWSDYSVTGSDSTWKYGFNWRPFDQLLVRVMEQRAARAPNIYELYGPQSTSLKQCGWRSVLRLAGCADADAGTAQALRVHGPDGGAGPERSGHHRQPDQLVLRNRSDQRAEPEQADTFTAGLVWTPDFGGETFKNWIFSVDYYDIDIQDYIGTFSPDEVLDACLSAG